MACYPCSKGGVRKGCGAVVDGGGRSSCKGCVLTVLFPEKKHVLFLEFFFISKRIWIASNNM